MRADELAATGRETGAAVWGKIARDSDPHRFGVTALRVRQAFVKHDQRDPIVVDLASRRKAVRKAQDAKRRPVQANDEPLVGRRPHARLILALLMAAALMIWLVPKLL